MKKSGFLCTNPEGPNLPGGKSGRGFFGMMSRKSRWFQGEEDIWKGLGDGPFYWDNSQEPRETSQH